MCIDTDTGVAYCQLTDLVGNRKVLLHKNSRNRENVRNAIGNGRNDKQNNVAKSRPRPRWSGFRDSYTRPDTL